MAWARLGQIVRNLPPTQAFDLACHIVSRLPRFYCWTFGGGTLAHLLRHHGAALIDWIEREALRDVRFFEALASACITSEEVDPAVVSRLRAATGARIRVLTEAERDAAYKEMFIRSTTSARNRRVRYRTRPSRVLPLALAGDNDSAIPSVSSWPSPAMGEAQGRPTSQKVPWWLRYHLVLFELSHTRIARRPSVVHAMAQGVINVSLFWLLLMSTRARTLFPFLIVVLGFTTTTLLVDLVLILGSFLLAAASGALAGLVFSFVSPSPHRVSDALAHIGFLSVIPYLAVLTLIARTERGPIVLAALLGALLLRPFITRWFRKARAKTDYAPNRG